MDIMETMRARHSVRQYTDRKIPEEVVLRLQKKIDACSQESGLHIQLVTEEPEAFAGGMAHYGSFRGVRNYIAMVGKDDRDLDEKCGYYGEQLVLLSQQLGLNTCWVAMTFSRGKAKQHLKMEPGEKIAVVIALGYGATQGVPHRSKPLENLTDAKAPYPEWFRRGLEAAQLAPTAMNQQKFRFSLDGETVRAVSLGGFYSRMDLGIVKYHFEAAAGRKVE